ncbi:hypothetical protein DENSPDRAFT_805940 [Dentipellis sp. KUC8613]|nr:hypothetical protein DENSPDRAFT_805940 [Dentipellis sp. KUC8613]
MSQTHFAHPGDLPYAPPVLRAASPSGSINTEYGPDETSLSDMELSPGEFEGKIEAALRLHEQRDQEVVAVAKPVLIPKPKTAAEEKQTFEQVMRCLRWHVQQLEENQIVENMMLRGSQAGLVAQPSSDDVGVIMASMMGSGGVPSKTSGGGGIGTSAMHVDEPLSPPRGVGLGFLTNEDAVMGPTRNRVHNHARGG